MTIENDVTNFENESGSISEVGIIENTDNSDISDESDNADGKTEQNEEMKTSETEHEVMDFELFDDFDTEEEMDEISVPEESDSSETEQKTKSSFKQFIKNTFGGWIIFKKSFWKKVGITAVIVVGSVCMIYLGGVVYYANHFFWGTHIGNFNCSNMSVQKAEEHITKRINEYGFTIYSKDGHSETITGKDVQLQLLGLGDIESYKKAQNPFLWPVTKQSEKNIPDEIDISINEEILAQRVNSLRCVSESIASLPGVTEYIYFDENEKKYMIADDGTRNIVSLSMMQEKVKGGILGLYPDMTLEKDGCYVGLAGDDTISAYLNALNTYISTTVDYQRGEENILLDGGTIHTWISTNADYTITLNYDAIKMFVSDLSVIYDTRGNARSIVSSADGQTVVVEGGDYGWRVDQNAEFEQLCTEIPTGQAIVREPIYKHTAAAHGPLNDLSNTYVEVSISHQKLWFYKDGNLVVSSNVVTGNPFMNNATHTGTFTLKYKVRDTVLVGDDYESPVHFWMPFNGGEGLHDAPWRGAFGGNIYRGGGSHGCVNLPYQTAKTIYENIQPGTPVVVY